MKQPSLKKIAEGVCGLNSLDYLSEANYDEIYESYINMRIEGGWTREEAESRIETYGINRDDLNSLYNEFVLGSDTGLVAVEYLVADKDAARAALQEQLLSNPNGTLGSFASGSAIELNNGEILRNTMPNMGHSIVIKEYDPTSKVVTFWDEGNECFGTCFIDDLECFTTAISGSTDSL